MEAEYFENKMQMILDITDLMVLHRNDACLVEKHKKNIKLILKEIAKDQRHACAEAVLRYNNAVDGIVVDIIHSAVMNTHIDKEI